MLRALVALSLLAAPAAGELAPDFTVRDIDGKVLELKTLVERHTVILAFFPKAFTPG